MGEGEGGIGAGHVLAEGKGIGPQDDQGVKDNLGGVGAQQDGVQGAVVGGEAQWGGVEHLQ